MHAGMGALGDDGAPRRGEDTGWRVGGLGSGEGEKARGREGRTAYGSSCGIHDTKGCALCTPLGDTGEWGIGSADEESHISRWSILVSVAASDWGGRDGLRSAPAPSAAHSPTQGWRLCSVRTGRRRVALSYWRQPGMADATLRPQTHPAGLR